uniref:Uncharacterized protein n=1 Tax=Rousettus aegyptiacus TaxID=9407 RepID=A0A7J8KBI4_ROUAE|nr:hypothetical protein HJG63_007996 [Rousettus aegyptiacus]
MGYIQSAFCQISCCEFGDAANINILLILNLENSLKAPDISVLPLFFFFFNLTHVTATVLRVVSNLLCSFPGRRKSLQKGTSGFLFLSSVISRFHFVPWSKSTKHMCSLWNSLNKQTINTL